MEEMIYEYMLAVIGNIFADFGDVSPEELKTVILKSFDKAWEEYNK